MALPQLGERGFRLLAYATVLVVYATIVVGAYVRATGSGLGCSDWPQCEPHAFFPDPANAAAMIEWAHRSIAAFAGLFILGLFLASLQYRRTDRRIMLSATVAFLLLPIQAGLGAYTVWSELNPFLSSMHMGVAAALFGAIVATAVFAHVGPRSPTAAAQGAEAPSFRGQPEPAAEGERA